MRRAFGAALLSIAVLASTFTSVSPLTTHADAGPKSWTIMVFMAANASADLPWEENLNDMESAEQSSGTNIITLVDPPAANTTLYHVAHDPGGANSVIVSPTIEDGGAVIPSSGDANMGAPETLESFIKYSTSNYPADVYVLILWGHGAAWRGLCPDGTDILTLPELGGALANASAEMWRPIDILSVDACAGATLEMLFEVWSSVRYFVGSEMNIPTEGLPYGQILNDLAANVDFSPSEFGTAIAEDYLSWSRSYSAYSATMTVFNTSEVHALMNQFREWVEIGTKFEGLFHSELQAVLSATEHYKTEYDVGDLGNHISGSGLPLDLQERYQAFLEVYNQSRVFSGSFDNPDATDGVRVAESTGLSFDCPAAGTANQSYADLQIASTGWMRLSNMVGRTAASNLSVEMPWLTYGSSEDYGPGLFDTVYVNWQNSYDWLDAWVFRQQPSGLVYYSVFSGSGNNLTIHNVAGDLVISASAGNATSALAYAELGPVPVAGLVRLWITLVNVTGGDEPVSVRVSGVKGTAYVNATMSLNATSPTLFVFHIYLFTPQNLTVGEKIDIRVELGERMSGNCSVLVEMPTTMAEVEMHENPSGEDQLALFMAMALLAVCLILIFVFLMRRERKHHDG